MMAKYVSLVIAFTTILSTTAEYPNFIEQYFTNNDESLSKKIINMDNQEDVVSFDQMATKHGFCTYDYPAKCNGMFSYGCKVIYAGEPQVITQTICLYIINLDTVFRAMLQ